MKYRKEIVTAAGTLTCAIGIGFFMQQGGDIPSPEYSGATLINASAAVLDVEEIILTSAEFADDFVASEAEESVTLAAAQEIMAPQEEALPVVQAAAAMDAPGMPSVDMAPAMEVEPEASCEVTATARAVAAAMVNLTLSAPCLPDERVTVHHAGMLFTESTDGSGAFDITVPAMVEDATFVVAFTNGEGAVAQTTVEELGDFDRVALQWKGDTGFELHAREFGADYGSAGHVWSGDMRDMTFAVTGRGGFLSLLGDVALSVETEVGDNNCGLEIEAQTLQTFSGKDITSRDLTLSVPDCDATGNFLVLNSLFEDLKVAAIN